MSDVNTKKCDECGKLRMSDSNHWLEGSASSVMLEVAVMGRLESADAHFCGQECAMKWVGRKIQELRD